MKTKRNKIFLIMGIIMLVAIITTGFFALPLGALVCSVIGLCYGIYQKDKLFVRWSSGIFLLAVAFIVWFGIAIQNMN